MTASVEFVLCLLTPVYNGRFDSDESGAGGMRGDTYDKWFAAAGAGCGLGHGTPTGTGLGCTTGESMGYGAGVGEMPGTKYGWAGLLP